MRQNWRYRQERREARRNLDQQSSSLSDESRRQWLQYQIHSNQLWQQWGYPPRPFYPSQPLDPSRPSFVPSRLQLDQSGRPQPLIAIPPKLLPLVPFAVRPNRTGGCDQCNFTDCPVTILTGRPHTKGIYADVYQPRTEWFGNSNPPDEVWDAVRRLIAGTHRHGDDLMISDFRRYHYAVIGLGQFPWSIVEIMAEDGEQHRVRSESICKYSYP